MWSTYFIFISILGAREGLSENNIKKRQIYYPISPNLYGYPGQHNFPQIIFPPAYYQPNDFPYRVLWLTPESTHEGTTKSFIGSRDNFDTTSDKASGSARKSYNSVIVDKNQHKTDTDRPNKSAPDEQLKTNVTIEAKLDDRGNDTLATGARVEVEISSDNSTDTTKTIIENKNSTAS